MNSWKNDREKNEPVLRFPLVQTSSTERLVKGKIVAEKLLVQDKNSCSRTVQYRVMNLTINRPTNHHQYPQSKQLTDVSPLVSVGHACR